MIASDLIDMLKEVPPDTRIMLGRKFYGSSAKKEYTHVSYSYTIPSFHVTYDLESNALVFEEFSNMEPVGPQGEQGIKGLIGISCCP